KEFALHDLRLCRCTARLPLVYSRLTYTKHPLFLAWNECPCINRPDSATGVGCLWILLPIADGLKRPPRRFGRQCECCHCGCQSDLGIRMPVQANEDAPLVTNAGL